MDPLDENLWGADTSAGTRRMNELPEELWGPAPTAAEMAEARRAAELAKRERRAQVASGSVTPEQAAALAGWSVRRLRAAVGAGDLVTVPGPRGPLVPVWQLPEGGGIVAGVADLARVLGGTAVALTLWVSRPSPDLNGRTPAQALADGDVTVVLDVARALTAAGW